MVLKLKQTTKPQVEQVVVPASELSDHATAIDNLAKLMADVEKAEAALLAVAKKEIDKVNDLRTKIAAEAKSLGLVLNAEADELQIADDTKDHQLKGHKFVAKLSAKGNSRKITDMATIKTIMDKQDPELFMKVITMTLKDVDAYLTQPERDKVLKTTRTPRTFTIEKKL